MILGHRPAPLSRRQNQTVFATDRLLKASKRLTLPLLSDSYLLPNLCWFLYIEGQLIPSVNPWVQSVVRHGI